MIIFVYCYMFLRNRKLYISRSCRATLSEKLSIAIKDLNPWSVQFSNVHISIRINIDCMWMDKLTIASAFSAPFSYKSKIFDELQYSVISSICYKNRIGGKSNVFWSLELVVCASPTVTPFCYKLAVTIKFLYSVIFSIYNVNIILRVYSYAVRNLKLAVGRPGRSPSLDKCTIVRKFLHIVIVSISYVNESL